MLRHFVRSVPFVIMVLALAGCQGISSFDLSVANNINGGLGEYGYDIAFEFAAAPAPENSLVIVAYSDDATRAAGYGFVQQHYQGFYFIQLDFTVDLGSGKYDAANYHAFIFTSPYQPEVIEQAE